MATISHTGKQRIKTEVSKNIKLTTLELLMVEFYAARYAKDFPEIIRGMIRKYTEADRSFVPEQFADYAEKVLIPNEPDPDVRATMRKRVREYRRANAG